VCTGQAAEAMICNRLTSPAPLVHIEDWARDWAAGEILGIPALALNDDRLGRTLDAIAPVLEEITGTVALRAIETFGIDISQLHWDMTSFSLHGACKQLDEDYPAPSYGHPKDRREDLLQIQAGIAASSDGGIPVFTHAYSGGAAEISQVIGAMNSLGKIAGTKKFLLVGDSRLISYDNVAAIGKAGCTFLAPRPGSTSRPPDWPPATWPGPARSTTSPDAMSTRRAPAPASWAAGTSSKTTGRSRSATPNEKATRRSRCAASSCTPVPAPTPPSPTGPGSSPAPKKTWTAWSPAWAAGSTPPSRRSPTGSSRSPATARSAPACATPPAPPPSDTTPPGSPEDTSRGADQVSRKAAMGWSACKGVLVCEGLVDDANGDLDGGGDGADGFAALAAGSSAASLPLAFSSNTFRQRLTNALTPLTQPARAR